MFKHMKLFFSKEDGAVTVDWVVLTAAVVGLAGAAIVSIEGSAGSVGAAVGTGLSSVSVDAGL